MASGTINQPFEFVDFTSQCTFPTGDEPAHFSAVAFGKIGIISYQGPAKNSWPTSTLVVTVPSKFSYDYSTYGGMYAPLSFNAVSAGTASFNSATTIVIAATPGTFSNNVRPYFTIVYPIA